MDADLNGHVTSYDHRLPVFSDSLYESLQPIQEFFEQSQPIKAEPLFSSPLLNEFTISVDTEVEQYNPMDSYVSDGDFTLFPDQQ